MTILKCKICGGNIVLTGQSHGVCDSCGTEVTLPKMDDEVRAELYNRANYARQTGDFDRAYSAFEHIVSGDPTDAEAHWCLVLCRYGIEYVQDAVTGERKPTCSRVNYDPILEDMDYREALRYSDEYTQELYRRDALQINRILQKYVEIARKEPPYDVFICFKALDDNGKRTHDSVIAQDIYDKLTEKGLKVFFSRITLQNKQGESYEPYIFAALSSAKVMILVATDRDHLEARWVKNEWSRYLAMMRTDKSRHILPVFSNMDPDDFPMEIPTYQGIDIGQVGAMQDLVRGVQKLTDHLEGGNARTANTDTQPVRTLTEAEKRIGKLSMIKLVNSSGSNTTTKLFENYSYSAAIDLDQFSVIVFHVDFLKPCTEARDVSFGRAIYDELGNLVNRHESSIRMSPGDDRIGQAVEIKKNGNILMPPGVYTAEFWVEDSAAYRYRFQIVSRKWNAGGLQVSQAEREKQEQKNKELEARQKAISALQEKIGDTRKYLTDNLIKKVPEQYEGYMACVKRCRDLEDKCPKCLWRPRLGLVIMVLMWLCGGILFWTVSRKIGLMLAIGSTIFFVIPLQGILGWEDKKKYRMILPMAVFIFLFFKLIAPLIYDIYDTIETLDFAGMVPIFLKVMIPSGLLIVLMALLWHRRYNTSKVLMKAVQKAKDYHAQYLYPAERMIQQELDEEYKKFTGSENPVKLGTILDEKEMWEGKQ